MCVCVCVCLCVCMYIYNSVYCFSIRNISILTIFQETLGSYITELTSVNEGCQSQGYQQDQHKGLHLDGLLPNVISNLQL